MSKCRFFRKGRPCVTTDIFDPTAGPITRFPGVFDAAGKFSMTGRSIIAQMGVRSRAREMEPVMKTQYTLAAAVSVLCLTFAVDAMAGFGNDLARCLGLGWSDGYHAQPPGPAHTPIPWGHSASDRPAPRVPTPTPAAALRAPRPGFESPVVERPVVELPAVEPPVVEFPTAPPPVAEPMPASLPSLEPSPPAPVHEARPIRIPPPTTRTSRWERPVR